MKGIVGVYREQKQGRVGTIKGLRGRKCPEGIAKRQSKVLKGIAPLNNASIISIASIVSIISIFTQ